MTVIHLYTPSDTHQSLAIPSPDPRNTIPGPSQYPPGLRGANPCGAASLRSPHRGAECSGIASPACFLRSMAARSPFLRALARDLRSLRCLPRLLFVSCPCSVAYNPARCRRPRRVMRRAFGEARFPGPVGPGRGRASPLASRRAGVNRHLGAVRSGAPPLALGVSALSFGGAGSAAPPLSDR